MRRQRPMGRPVCPAVRQAAEHGDEEEVDRQEVDDDVRAASSGGLRRRRRSAGGQRQRRRGVPRTDGRVRGRPAQLQNREKSEHESF